MPLFAGFKESLKQHIPRPSEPEIKRRSSYSIHDHYQALEVLVPEDTLPVGSIIDSLETMTRLNPQGQTAAFSILKLFNFDCPKERHLIRAQDTNARYLIRAYESQCRYKADVSYEECREAVETSEQAREWFRITGYKHPAYIVVGCQSFCKFDLVPASGSLDGSGREPVRCIKSSADRRNQIYRVKLIKLSYKKSLLSNDLKLVCEEQ